MVGVTEENQSQATSNYKRKANWIKANADKNNIEL